MLERIKNNYILILILILGTILRLYHIDFQSIWLDEIHTMIEANPSFSFSEVYEQIISGEQIPPHYFIIINLLFKLFGYSSLVVRLFSVFIGVLGVYSIYLLLRELKFKSEALIAAFLLSINYFHIYYSQEARPYVLFFLFINLSFYFLVKFLNKKNWKNAITYGLSSGFLIGSHLFGFFVLFSQLLIFILYFVFNKRFITKSNFLKLFVSSIIIILFLLPSIEIIINSNSITSFWIGENQADAFTNIFSDLFGKSEFLFTMFTLSVILFFIKLSKINNENFTQDKVFNTSVILFIWLTLVILIPLIRSYLSVPMIINRYFISILPALIIIMSIGITSIRNRFLLYMFIIIFSLFSFTDIFIVKNYYNKVTKTQFREGSNFIIENNKNNSKVVTSLGWYFNYFLNNDKVKYKVIDKSLENYIEEIKLDTTNLEEFWYVDAHNSPYSLSESSEKFLEKNFSIENNIDLIDCWAKFYVKKTNELKVINMSQFELKDKLGTSNINYWIESFIIENNEIKVNGWAYLKNQDAYLSRIRLILIQKEISYELPVEMKRRNDITKSDRTGYNYDNSGFFKKINTEKLRKGEYKIGILILNKNQQELVITDKKFVN